MLLRIDTPCTTILYELRAGNLIVFCIVSIIWFLSVFDEHVEGIVAAVDSWVNEHMLVDTCIPVKDIINIEPI